MSQAVRPTSRPLVAAVALLALAPLAYLLLSLTGLSITVPGVERTRPAPDFTAPGLNSASVRLADLRGRPVVLNFWASWCPPCRAEMPEFERVWQTYRDQGVIFVGVNTSDRGDKAQSFLLESKVSYQNVVDATNDIAVMFAATSLPTTVFIDREGRIVSRRVGAMSAQQVATQVEDLLR